MTTYCLDAWSVVAWLRDDVPPADRVDDALAAGTVMSWINLGEVFYILARDSGTEEAGRTVQSFRRRLEVESPSPERVLEAAAIKALRPMSYADAFAVATALAHDAVLLTGDPEVLDADADWPVEDIR